MRVDEAQGVLVTLAEYGWEYRLVSGTCNMLQFAAAMTPGTCRLFQFVAVCRNRSGKTLNPKVVGSIPTRPIRENPVLSIDRASIVGVVRGHSYRRPLRTGASKFFICFAVPMRGS